MISLKATILFDGSLWLGLFERTDQTGFAIARRVFNGEPSDNEIYDFVLHNYSDLKLGNTEPFQLVIERGKPPKRSIETPSKKSKRSTSKNRRSKTLPNADQDS
jgi:hypothetical protein